VVVVVVAVTMMMVVVVVVVVVVVLVVVVVVVVTMLMVVVEVMVVVVVVVVVVAVAHLVVHVWNTVHHDVDEGHGCNHHRHALALSAQQMHQRLKPRRLLSDCLEVVKRFENLHAALVFERELCVCVCVCVCMYVSVYVCT
jgi:hypothetical protein